MDMRIKFWGVRGSVPTPMNERQLYKKYLHLLELAANEDLSSNDKRIKFLSLIKNDSISLLGGNTSCIEVEVNNTHFIFDMGSGIRELGYELLKKLQKVDKLELHIFMSHTHWDHIQGFPFFLPAYNPKCKINFYSSHPELEKRLRDQQDFRFFPVSVNYMSAQKNFIELEVGKTININGIEITNMELYHPGESFTYKVEFNGKKFVFATDGEYNNVNASKLMKYCEFYHGADLLVFDAQYSFEEEIQKIDWGHSSALFGIDLCIKANVKRLALFHHAPERDDEDIFGLLKTALLYKTKNYPTNQLELVVAKEGLEYII